uniref:CBM20 domain-containing protein n=1 Tax=Chromera velia CCMP2878 TaxID=1169474 RepID=A0A0G4F5T0_9ALVE|eukprot:Cvel_15189.t1-p1 / transcript=Cvel_15189.t1 / gene=Cvel_15189 / organism=Chromera_velia_CCMP2878 / gene_product=hypothetical protein / transcript_product=hypothetical protein / location=Cvel_scaffold1110:47245-48729(-) / protein_length=495 / sequence_SO=supercontig / SO=protein_coding / is_pseudo=false
MKGLIAFVAHCPEVRENQRVVVVGECAELGGWDLGGALSLTPAPCVHPWWVSSEVEVNLSECTMGVSGDFESEVETDRKVGRVGVSKLNFRLVAVPNSSNEVEVSDPDNPVCLEPLNGGDFRAVCLVDGLPPVDRCSVGERGHNTIHIGAEEGGEEQQKREMVGILVEWGVPESVQLGLIPLHPNGQTDHPQSETVAERGGLSCPQSESAYPVSSEERTQRDSEEMLARTDEGQHASSLSMHPPQSAAEFEGQHPDSRVEMEGDGGNNSQSEPERQKTTRVEGGEEDVCAEGADSVGGSKAPADTESDSMRPRSRPLPPTRHLSHDRTLDGQREEWPRTQGVADSLKRLRSEASFSDAEAEADECHALSGFPVAGEGAVLQGKEGGVMREEKQRRLTVSVWDSARLSSEFCVGKGGPIGEAKVGVSRSDSRGGKGGGGVKRNRHGQILCSHGRVRYRCKECGGGSICEHGRERHRCKECGGKGICEHGRQRSLCK